jgi:UDP-N-acetylglucosamine--N-acetylmuramyl-(pentapeptide) pyrophosphoryl-undecaprenol N-acetylglucosamine transferase
LIIGGSQVARSTRLPEAVALTANRPQLWHQTGKRDEASVAETYRNFLPDARVAAFIEDMAAAYAWADVVVCRAGAMTIAELAAAGVAAILVRFACRGSPDRKRTLSGSARCRAAGAAA